MALVLSKYEKVQIIASRVEQLVNGAPSLDSSVKSTDLVKIAEMELEKRVLPVRISRKQPDGSMISYPLEDFIDPSSLISK